MIITQLIDNLLKPMEKHTEEAQVQEETTRLPVSHARNQMPLVAHLLHKGQDSCLG